jgi:DNA polymerase-3 subunit epsilon
MNPHPRTTQWFDHPIALLDVETTGVDARADRVVEVAVVVEKSGEIVSRRSWLVNPGRPIAAEATKIHGITNEAVAKAPTFADIAVEITATIGATIPGAYSAKFDNAFLGAEYLRIAEVVPPWLSAKVEWVDPLVFIWHFDKFRKGKKLVDACLRRGIQLDQAHRATIDAEASLRILYALSRESTASTHGDWPQTLPRELGDLLDAQLLLAAEQDAQRRRYWRDNPEKRPSL